MLIVYPIELGPCRYGPSECSLAAVDSQPSTSNSGVSIFLRRPVQTSKYKSAPLIAINTSDDGN